MPDLYRNSSDTFLDYLLGQPEYTMDNNQLIRPDGTVAARLNGDKWNILGTSDEFAGYMRCTGRAMPSLLPYHDPTNPGHSSTPSGLTDHPERHPPGQLTDSRNIAQLLRSMDTASETGLLVFMYMHR